MGIRGESPLGIGCLPQIRCCRVPERALVNDPTLPATEVWTPARMIIAVVRGEHKVVAIEWAAVRDTDRKMKLRSVL